MSYTRCPECGFILGKYAYIIKLARQARNIEFFSKQENKDLDPDKLMFQKTPVIGDILDAFCIKNICCRTHYITVFDTYEQKTYNQYRNLT